MPPSAPSLSSTNDEDVAFKVLNQDNLPISIVGEAILKPFGNDNNQKLKPNVIVHPTRRFNIGNLEENKQRPLAKSSGHISKDNKILKTDFSYSHGNLQQTNGKLKVEDWDQFDSRFTKTLDAKLKRLQKDEKQQKSKQQAIENGRKPFVTTVKKGQFLEPPPEIANLIGIKLEEPPYRRDVLIKERRERLYAFASQPRVLNRETPRNVHLSRCDAAARAAAKLAGTVAGIKEEFFENYKKNLDGYANVMFEKRIYRGSNFAVQTSGQGDGESSAARAAEAKRRAAARRKAKNQQFKTGKFRIGSPPPVPGRKHERIQTELYLEEIFVNPQVEHVCTQTEIFLERPVSPFYVPVKTGVDIETQIYPGDLFDFDMEVQPILEILVGKTIEQALVEVLEEEELAAVREQRRRFMDLRAAETAEALRLEEKEKRFVRETEERIAECERGLQVQKEMEERIAAAVLMQGYMADLLPSVLQSLESEGFLMNTVRKDVDESFMPWLLKEVTHELQEMVTSRDVLTDIVREILENRAELYQALEDLSEEPAEEASQQDIALQDHMKLKEEISKMQQAVEET